MILSVNAGIPPQNNGKITSSFTGASSDSVSDHCAKAAFNPQKIGTPDALVVNTSPQTGWQTIYTNSLEGSSFAGYAAVMTQTQTTSPKTSGKNALWKQIIAEAARSAGTSTSQPSAGGDPFASGYSVDLSSSVEDSGE